MHLYIKNMVCNRCIMVVTAELEKLGLHPLNVTLGEVVLQEKKLPKEHLKNIQQALQQLGFELIDDKKSKLIEQLKSCIVDLIHYSEPIEVKYSAYLTDKLHHDYTYLSKLFSEVEGITIEHYIIKQKIERAKELLAYDELSLSEIADRLGYSSVAHLSAQFKKVTGLTPTFFKNKGMHARIPIDKIK
ncbi:MAG: helix-turn-helix transcriptional regulator [Bacteroidetes bacterium]|nr:helix-turn-helix transcriptional regulator [Bacteroidota bacterium]